MFDLFDKFQKSSHISIFLTWIEKKKQIITHLSCQMNRKTNVYQTRLYAFD